MLNNEIIRFFKYQSLIQFRCNDFITVDILQHIISIWERQISTDKEDPGIYRDDNIEYEITKDNDIIILDVF